MLRCPHHLQVPSASNLHSQNGKWPTTCPKFWGKNCQLTTKLTLTSHQLDLTAVAHTPPVSETRYTWYLDNHLPFIFCLIVVLKRLCFTGVCSEERGIPARTRTMVHLPLPCSLPQSEPGQNTPTHPHPPASTRTGTNLSARIRAGYPLLLLDRK